MQTISQVRLLSRHFITSCRRHSPSPRRFLTGSLGHFAIPVKEAVSPRFLATSTVKTMSTSRTVNGLSFLCQKDAIEIDNALFGTFSVDQLMELAGLSCAQAIEREFKDRSLNILIVAGPGNNGGDGLVCARHLKHFGYENVDVLYPKIPAEADGRPKPLFRNLKSQMDQLNLPVFVNVVKGTAQESAEGVTCDLYLAKDQDSGGEKSLSSYDVYVDAIFGFSFKGWRGGGKDHPFDSVVRYFKSIEDPAQKKSIISIDIPSGWQIDEAQQPEESVNDDPKALNASAETSSDFPPRFSPHMLISLTAPKLGSLSFQGVHYVGGRFVPPDVLQKFNLALPKYPDAEQVVRISAAS